MAKAKLVGFLTSPFVRSIATLLDILKVDYELVDPSASDENRALLHKLNPKKQVPAFQDSDGFVLTESRAILIYLVRKYDNSKNLYPEELKVQAKVNSFLFFDGCLLFPSFFSVFGPIAFKGRAEVRDEEVARLKDVLHFLDSDLKNNGDSVFIAGTKEFTLADLSVICTLRQIRGLENVFFNWSDYPNIAAWEKRVRQAIPVLESIEKAPLEKFTAFAQSKVAFAKK